MKTLAALLTCLAATPAAACQLALVLAIDISNSVDAAEYQLQTEGLAEALLDAEVRQNLVQGQMAVSVVFWSGAANQYLVVPWQRMTSKADVIATADKVRGLSRVYMQSNTALGALIGYARGLFDAVPDCTRRTLDISGDGIDNAGTVPQAQRDRARAAGITVNGLAIDRPDGALTRYFRDAVITPNGFVMTANGHKSYAETLKRKLRRETGEAMM